MNKSEKKKSFLGKLIDKLDKKMEEKAKTRPCCGSKDGTKGKSCCS
ncbi:MAG: hypothetical protein JW734_06605 [Candidatus Omnitrophica bacterium]|nr:hypothetical protein [Candidatus Omnitrophota bacterium]